MKKKIIFCWFIGLFLFADYLFLALQINIGSSVAVLVGTTALAVGMLALLFYMGEKGHLQLPTWAILSFALAYRLIFLFQSPQLSDDIFRYLWDGLQLLHGNNPYSLTPATSIALDPWSAAILKKVNHPQLFTIYPPAAQMIFAAGAALARDIVGLKIILIVLDMAACAVIIKLLHTMKLPPWRAVLYAWHPLPIIEIAWSGHIDGAAIFFFLIAVFLLVAASKDKSRRKVLQNIGGGAALALSIMVKLIPLIYLPILLCAATGPLYLIGGCVAVLACLSIPFLPDLAHMFLTLGTYLQNWEFANGAFRALRTLLVSGNITRVVLASLTMLSIAAITISFWRHKLRKDYDESLDLMKLVYGITFTFLLLTPTLHPWYALYLVVLLPFAGGPAGLVLSWAVFLAYHVLIRYSILGEWVEHDVVAATIWLSPVLAWLLANSRLQLSGRIYKGIRKIRGMSASI